MLRQQRIAPCDLCRIARRTPNPGFNAGQFLRRERWTLDQLQQRLDPGATGLQRSCHFPQPVARGRVAPLHQFQQRSGLYIQVPFRQRENPRRVGTHQQFFRCRVAHPLVDLLGNIYRKPLLAVRDQLLHLGTLFWSNLGHRRARCLAAMKGIPTLKLAFVRHVNRQILVDVARGGSKKL